MLSTLICRLVRLRVRPSSMVRLITSDSSDSKISGKVTSMDMIRELERNPDEVSLYPFFRQMNITTSEKAHTLTASCDNIIRYIRTGFLNKFIGIQYCHYLAELSRNSSEESDARYYAEKCHLLMSFILSQRKEIPSSAISRLLCDISSTSSQNCLAISNLILDAKKIGPLKEPKYFLRLLGSCYKFEYWSVAQALIENLPNQESMFTVRHPDVLVDGLISTSQTYKRLESIEEKTKLRSDVIKHLVNLLEIFAKNRIQFYTKSKTEAINALKDLDLNVVTSPTIKLSGRCTCCNTHVPLFDNSIVAEINSGIKRSLLKGSDKGLYINTSPSDLGRFEEFLKDIHHKDMKPLDCVIDGPNVAYRNSQGVYYIKQKIGDDLTKSVKRHRPEAQVQVLINIIIRGLMLEKFKKILVIGKAHMTRWPGLLEFFKEHNIYYYSSFNNSQDDLFQMFASTLNPRTVLISNDFFRDHLKEFAGQERAALERWIDTHQAWIDRRTLKPIWPTPYEKLPSNNREANCFHIPLIDSTRIDKVGILEPPPHLNSKMLTWICCKI